MQSFLKTSRKSLWKANALSLCALASICCSAPPPLPISWGLDLSLESEKRPRPKLKNNKEPYGPSFGPSFSLESAPASKPTPVLCLTLSPGLYRTMAFIPILKAIEERDIYIPIIGGHGLSAIIATYYAFGLGPDLIEWKFHKFLTLHKNLSPYSKPWMKALEKMIQRDFAGTFIEQAKLNLFIPVYNPATKMVEYKTKGKVKSALMANITLHSTTSQAAFLKEVFHVPKMKSLGADVLIGLNVLGGTLKWKKAKDFVVGLFSRSSGLSRREGQALNLYREINMGKMELDHGKAFAEITRLGQASSREISTRIKETITSWPNQTLKQGIKL